MSRYNEIMDHIEMTDEMRERILTNIHAMKKRKRINTVIKCASAAAACLVLTVCSTLLYRRMNHPQTPPDESSIIAQNPDIQPGVPWEVQEYDSIESLSKAIGIELHDLTELPYEVKERKYAMMSGKFAEINYTDPDIENCCIRIGRDTEDISENYNDFDNVSKVDVSGITVTISGYENVMYLGTWIKDDHFYALWMDHGTDQEHFCTSSRQ